MKSDHLISLKKDALAKQNEMEQLTYNFDWSNTSLGPIEDWPQSLITILRTMLASRYPMWLGWGNDIIFFYNDAYAKMSLGPKHPWALGKTFREVWSEVFSEIGPLVDSVMQTGKATWNEGLLLFLERNGFPEETYHTFSYSPVFENSGSIGGILCVVTEDTERNIGERRLRTLRELAARPHQEVNSVQDACQNAIRILENNPKDVPFSLLYMLDENSSTLSLAASCGIKTNTPISPTLQDLEDFNSPWPFAEVIRSGGSIVIHNLANQYPYPGGPWPEPSPQAIILPLTKAGQSQITGFLVVGISARRPLDDGYRTFFELVAGHVGIAISNARAFEEERRRAEALAEIDRAKTAFFSNVSHEFRTPLTLMLGPIEEMLHKLQAHDTENQAALELVYRNGLRLQRLVNTLLDFSRIEAGRVRACFQPTNISAYTADLASNFSSVCEKAGLKLTVDCPPIAQPVFLDQHMWEKIVLNLLSNAFKFTFSGEICVAIRQLEDAVELSVRDTGIGISAEEMPRLFERFHRIETAKGRTYEGSGIGLALISELVKLLYGSIVAESKLGCGTTFVIKIPLGKDHLPQEQIEYTAEGSNLAAEAQQFVDEALRWLPENQVSSTYTKEWVQDSILPTAVQIKAQKTTASILVVDDNADMRQYLIRLLSPLYHVTTAGNGEIALALAREYIPDLIISDAMMPVLDGFGLLKELRSNTTTSSIPVIILSARAGEENRIEGMQSDADEYLVKPFSARVLLASVSAHIKMSRLRQEAHEAVRKSEERLRALLEATSDVVYRMNPDWTELRFLRGREFIPDTLQPSKTWINKYIHPEDQDNVNQIIQQAIRTKQVFELEHRVIRVDGTLGWAHSRAIPIMNQKGKILEWFGAASDVSFRKEYEHALLDASRHKDEFIATLAHELRNPLAPVLSALKVMRLAKNDIHAVEKAQCIMERQIAQMVRLIDDLLDLSRISHGKISLQKECIELEKVIQQVIETAHPIIKTAEHTLEVNLPGTPIYLEADNTRLAQIFNNLLNNAVKYTEKGGVICLSVSKEQEQVIVSILDNGIGIPKTMLSHIFEKFTQVNIPSERNPSGLGIGLSLVKQLVELHGGTVEARSKGKNLGSEFIVRLPISSQPTKPETHILEATNSSKQRRILVVDDNIDIATSLAMLLEIMGHQVQMAGNGLEAIQVASAFRPEVIFMDIGMPEFNGYDAARELRKFPWGENIILIALTGWSQERDYKQSLEAGFDYHITKPGDIDNINELLNNIEPTTA